MCLVLSAFTSNIKLHGKKKYMVKYIKMTRQAMCVKRIANARSHNHCSCGKTNKNYIFSMCNCSHC